MKKLWVIWLAVLLALAMYGCSSAGSTYTVTKNGTDYVVDQENGTISDGTNTYRYTASSRASGYRLEITYPDGSTYWWEKSANTASGGRSEDYDETRYVSGEVLRDILEEGALSKSGGISMEKLVIAILLLAAGLFNAISPYKAWYLRYGWRYKNTQPSELALGVGRIGGILIIILAVVLLFI